MTHQPSPLAKIKEENMTTGITKQKQVCPKCGRLRTKLVRRVLNTNYRDELGRLNTKYIAELERLDTDYDAKLELLNTNYGAKLGRLNTELGLPKAKWIERYVCYACGEK